MCIVFNATDRRRGWLAAVRRRQRGEERRRTWIQQTCAEVNDEIKQKDGVRNAVEDDPACAEIVVEEGDGDRQNDEVCDQQHQHEQVPVEPSNKNTHIKTY